MTASAFPRYSPITTQHPSTFSGFGVKIDHIAHLAIKDLNMAHLVVLPIHDGHSIVVEVESTDPGRVTRGGSAENLVRRAATSFEESFAQIKPAAAHIVSELRDAVQDTESVVVKFGIKCNAEAGAFIAKAAGEANFEVTISWKRQNAAAETKS